MSNLSNVLGIKQQLNQMGKFLRDTFDTMGGKSQNNPKSLWGENGLLPRGLLVNNYQKASVVKILFLPESLQSCHRFPSWKSSARVERLLWCWKCIKPLEKDVAKSFGLAKTSFEKLVPNLDSVLWVCLPSESNSMSPTSRKAHLEGW